MFPEDRNPRSHWAFISVPPDEAKLRREGSYQEKPCSCSLQDGQQSILSRDRESNEWLSSTKFLVYYLGTLAPHPLFSDSRVVNGFITEFDSNAVFNKLQHDMETGEDTEGMLSCLLGHT